MDWLTSLGQSIPAFIFVLGVMIFIHELGHHLVAKWLGIRVETFSLGFGPRLFGFQMGGTDYRVSVLPLGGYVKMAGEHLGEELTGSPEEFLSRPKFHRFLIAVAGPIMNILLAITLMAVVFMIGIPYFQYLDEPALIGAIDPDSPAREAGLQFRDRIVAINGETIDNWRQADLKIAINARTELTLNVERGGEMLSIPITPEARGPSEVGSIGIHPWAPYLIARLTEEDSPAVEAGLQPGDEVVSVSAGGDTARGFYGSVLLVNRVAPKAVTYTIRRGHETFQRSIAPMIDRKNSPREGKPRYIIGVQADIPTSVEQYGLVDSVTESVKRNYTITALLFDILRKLVTGQTSIRQLSGPIEIARFSGQAASQGALQLMTFMAFISLQLGILNLLPIPILDGGVITLLAVEGIIGRDLSLTVKERIIQAGFIFLILLMSVVIVNDILKTGVFD